MPATLTLTLTLALTLTLTLTLTLEPLEGATCLLPPHRHSEAALTTPLHRGSLEAVKLR